MSVQFNGMVRLPKVLFNELNVNFKGKESSVLEKKIEKILKTKGKFPPEFLPQKRSKFCYYYKVGKLEIATIFSHEFRIIGVPDGNTLGNIIPLDISDERYLERYVAKQKE
jgi:hypothetical protein